MASAYGTLGVLVEAITRPMEQQISSAATRSGEEASAKISSHMSRGLAKLGPAVGAIGKGVATGLGLATAGVVAFGVEAFRAASKVDAMALTLDALAKANGLSAARVQDTVGAVSRMGVTMGQAQTFVGTLVRGHIDLAHATDLTRISQNLAAATGKDLASVQGAVTKAILSGNAGALKRTGIVVDSTGAEKKMAAALGITTSQLTVAQKSQATLNAVMAAGKTVSGAYAAQLKTPQGALRLLKVDLSNITDTIGSGLVKALTPAFTGLAKLGAGFAGALGPGGKLEPIVRAIGSVAAKMAAPLGHFITSLTTGFNKLSPATITKIADAIRKFGPALLGIGAGAAVFAGAGLAKDIPMVGGLLEHLTGPLAKVVGAKGFGGLGLAAVKMLPGLHGIGGELEGLAGGLGKMAGPVGIILAIFGVLMATSPAFRKAVMSLVQTLAIALMPVFKSLMTAVKPLIPIVVLLGRTLGAILAPVVKALTPLLLSLVPLLVLVADVIALILPLVIQLIMPILKVYMAFEKWYVMKVLIPVIKLVTGVLTELIKIITDVVKWIVGGSPGLIPAFTALQRIVVRVTGVIRSVVVAGFTAIRNAIQAAWRFITTSSVNTWNLVGSTVRNAIRAVVGVVGSGIATVRGLISRGLAAALGAVRSWGSSLLSAGKSAIGALLNGIVSAMSGIGSWIKAHVVDPITNAVKSFFHMGSPSRLMEGLGRNVGTGFIQGLIKANPIAVAKHVFGGLPQALGQMLKRGMVSVEQIPARALNMLGKLGGSIGGFFSGLFGGGGAGGAGVAQWGSTISTVLRMLGLPASYRDMWLRQVASESGGNRFAINTTDINAQMGDPSRGILQTIMSTFLAYAGPFRSLGIFNGMANAFAAINYALHRYGRIGMTQVIGQGHGYAGGGVVNEPVTGFGHRTGEMYHFGERGPELVTPLDGQGGGRFGGAPITIHVHPQKGQSEVEIAAAVSRRLGWAMATGRA